MKHEGGGNTVQTQSNGLLYKQLLDESLVIFPHHSSLLQARAQLYLQAKNTTAALQLLTRITTPTQNESYLALLAAAHQQNKTFGQASTYYQTLVKLRPDKAEYWLGLGITQDALDQQQEAYNAYQQALKLNTLNTAVTDYIKQRSTKLTPSL